MLGSTSRPRLEIDVRPPHRENLVDTKPRQGSDPNRGDRRAPSLLGVLQRPRERRELIAGKDPAPGLLASALDATHGIRVLRTPIPVLRQTEDPRHEGEDAISLRRTIRKTRHERLDILTNDIGDRKLAETGTNVAPRMEGVLARRALAEPARLDPVRDCLAEEPVEGLVDGRRLAVLATTLEWTRLAVTEPNKLRRSPPARLAKTHLLASTDGRKTLPAPPPVE